MILGVGNDIIDIRRIEKALERYGERFLARVTGLDDLDAQLLMARATGNCRRGNERFSGRS